MSYFLFGDICLENTLDFEIQLLKEIFFEKSLYLFIDNEIDYYKEIDNMLNQNTYD